MKRADFAALPSRKWNEGIGLFDSLVILPLRTKHDSGYRLLDFVACRGQQAVCRLSGCSDVLHINGIGGYGKPQSFVPRSMPVVAWTMDCLPKSGLLRLFCHGDYKLSAGVALSSFEVFAEKSTDET